jgi:glutathione synthase/RimK-type ligase-like ATP-grasp enzyme
LKEAISAGLKVPNTLVTNNKNDLLKFIKKDKRYIIKSLYHPPFLETEDSYYSGNGTVLLNIEEVSNQFAPSLIQEYVEKAFEIRFFFNS